MIDKRLDELKTSNEVDTVILCGIETHVCIVATCIDLIHRGFNVIVIYFSRCRINTFIKSEQQNTVHFQQD